MNGSTSGSTKRVKNTLRTKKSKSKPTGVSHNLQKFGNANKNQSLYQAPAFNFGKNFSSSKQVTNKQVPSKQLTRKQLQEKLLSYSPDDHIETLCRICQTTDDTILNQQVGPCACSGTTKFVHIACLKKWRQLKHARGEDVSSCELCKQLYKIHLLGEEGATVDNKIYKMEEDLKDLATSGTYLLMLMKNMKLEIMNRSATNQPPTSSA